VRSPLIDATPLAGRQFTTEPLRAEVDRGRVAHGI
jgi:hypothetical protein